MDYMKIGLIAVSTVLSDFNLAVETNILKPPLVDFHFHSIHSWGCTSFGSLVLLEFSFSSLIRKSNAVKY